MGLNRRRVFQAGGLCGPERHYALAAESRLGGARELIDDGRYFAVCGARKTGKTTALDMLARDLTGQGRYAALRFSCTWAQTFPDDIAEAEEALLRAIRYEALQQRLPSELRPPDPWPAGGLFEGVQGWALRCPRPLVLFLDDADALRGKALLGVLARLREGFRSRPYAFPASVALCGVRDLLGGDAPSLRVGNFTRGNVTDLLEQYTAETGRAFTPGAVLRIYDCTQGQPWLVNALGADLAETVSAAPGRPVTSAQVGAAKERLICARACHLESLETVLRDPRVQRAIEPMVAGTFRDTGGRELHKDLAYARDLGLVAASNPVRIANPIYNEVIPSVLAGQLASRVPF